MPALVRTPYGLRKPPAGSQIDWAHPLAKGLVMSYDFLEGAGLSTRDSVTGAVATLGSAVKWQGGLGHAPPSLNFPNDTTNGFITVPIGPMLTGFYKNFSISALIYNTSLTGANNIYNSDLSAAQAWELDIFSSKIDLSGLADHSGTSTLVINRWYHVCVTKTGDSGVNLVFYLNGLQDGTGTQVALAANTGGVARIGRGNFSNVMKGNIAYVRIRSYPMSPSEVLAEYEEPFSMLRGPDLWRRYFV